MQHKRVISIAALVAAGSIGLSACGSSGGSSGSGSSSTSGAGSSASTGNPSSAVTINEAGSSLLYPFLQEVVSPLNGKFSNIKLAPAAGGSGKGISDAISGAADLGGSDAYLSPGQLQQNSGLLNIPVVVSAQAVNYNVDGVKDLKLSGDVLAKMYQGTITMWNDPAIAALNSGVTLPATKVVPVRRVDSSGDTFLFTSFLSATNSTWKSGPAFGTTVTWPAASGEVTASGNPGMVQTCKATPGCVAYVGVSSESDAKTAGLGEAMLQNKDGKFLQPEAANITAAANAGAGSIPKNLAQSLIFEPGATSYPITNFEYLVVKATQASADKALAIRTFLTFAMDPNGGSTQALLSKEGFVALPSSVAPKAAAAVATITGG